MPLRLISGNHERRLSTHCLRSETHAYTERINQIDLRVSKTFKRGRVSVSPTLEAFNLNNSDAVVSAVSTNVLASSYLRPNSILQGRIIGIGVNVRW